MTSINFILSHGIREINKRDYDLIRSNPLHPNYNKVSVMIIIDPDGNQTQHYVLEYSVTTAVIVIN